jgi:hypothetical protein
VIRGAHLARSIIENIYWEGFDRIFRKSVDLWTHRGHHGRLIAVSSTSWASDGLKFWLFENVSPYENLAVIFDLGL